jgi:hypothetical protein
MHRLAWRIRLVSLFCLLAAVHAYGAESEDVSLELLRSHVHFLASDHLGGRVIGTPGYRTAAEYVASQLAAAGVAPLPGAGKERGAYLHPVPVAGPGATAETCHNVVGFVPGTDPGRGDEVVVVCAHLDHIPPIDGEICNGADDNASGCAAVLEIARLVAREPFERPVLFVFFTGEDYAADPRLGSRHFIAHGPVARDRFFVNVNVDMIGREDTYWPKPGAITVMNSESVCPELRQVCARANENGSRLPLHYDVSQGGSSDSLSFAEAGIPSLGLFCGAHADLHQPSDEVDRLSFPRIRQVTGLGLDIVRELAAGGTELCP